MSFANQLKAFQAKTSKKMVNVTQSVVLELGERLLERSPIGQWDLWSPTSKASRPRPPYVPGQFIGSWSYSFGSPSDEVISTIDETGDSSRLRFSKVVLAPAAGYHFLSNNLDYAMLLEKGYAIDPSKAHMVDLAKVEFRSIVASEVSRVSKT